MSEYPGPPITSAPAPGWQPELIETAGPPRILPDLDHAAIDAEECAARRFTLLVGAVAAGTLAVLAFVLALA